MSLKNKKTTGKPEEKYIKIVGFFVRICVDIIVVYLYPQPLKSALSTSFYSSFAFLFKLSLLLQFLFPHSSSSFAFYFFSYSILSSTSFPSFLFRRFPLPSFSSSLRPSPPSFFPSLPPQIPLKVSPYTHAHPPPAFLSAAQTTNDSTPRFGYSFISPWIFSPWIFPYPWFLPPFGYSPLR